MRHKSVMFKLWDVWSHKKNWTGASYAEKIPTINYTTWNEPRSVQRASGTATVSTAVSSFGIVSNTSQNRFFFSRNWSARLALFRMPRLIQLSLLLREVNVWAFHPKIPCTHSIVQSKVAVNFWKWELPLVVWLVWSFWDWAFNLDRISERNWFRIILAEKYYKYACFTEF